jgi:hypothetical protein
VTHLLMIPSGIIRRRQQRFGEPLHPAPEAVAGNDLDVDCYLDHYQYRTCPVCSVAKMLIMKDHEPSCISLTSPCTGLGSKEGLVWGLRG